ncbi:glycosyl hydrolase family 28-related protein [Paenibacillus sp. GCM10012303]|uniref:glycosyl hydrolase family 28-related protein n=1 Tax=Paenibacillus sp. GCM10012303 TaxID=3317340 RepID=UPI00360906C5
MNPIEPIETKTISRRTLVASMGMAGAGMLLGQYSPVPRVAHANPLPLEWNVVTDFGAVGDGTTDDTSAIQSALNATATGGTVYFPMGTYLISSQLTVSNKEIHLFATGKAVIKEASVFGVPMLKLLHAHGSTVTGLSCHGAETYAGFAGASSLFNAFIQLDRCNQAVISGCSVKDKTYPFLLSVCQECHVTDCYVVGFLNVGKTGANYCSCCYISGGLNNSVRGLVGKDMGSGILVGAEGTNHHISDCYFENMWDNGVYISSGKGNLIEHITVKQTGGSGVKARGHRHIVSNCHIQDCLIGFTITGNGATPDSLGYNGYGTILEGCVAENCRRDGVLMNVQDGYLPRNIKIVNNTLINCATEGGGYAGVRMTAGVDTEVCGNTFHHCSGSFGILIVGPQSAPVSGLKIMNNFVSETREGIRLQYVTHSVITGNHVRDIDTYGIWLNNCNNNIISSNIGQEQVTSGLLRCLTADGSSNNTIIGNRATLMDVSREANVLIGNLPGTVNFTDDVTGTPLYEGQQAIVSGNLYMAAGSTSSTDWKQIS